MIAESMRLPRTQKIWLYCACALVGAQAIGSLLLRQGYALSQLTDLSQTLLLLSGAFAIGWNIFLNRGRAKVFWAFMTLGLGMLTVYQIIWSYWELVLHREVPNPFGADIIAFLHLVPMTAALAIQPHFEHDERSTRLGSLDFALLFTWWLYLYAFTVFPWQYVYLSEAAYSHNVTGLYFAEEIVFVGALIVVWIQSNGDWKANYAHWIRAGMVYGFGSFIANWAIGRNHYYSGSVYDIPISAFYVLVTAIGLWAACSPANQQRSQARMTQGVWVARLGMAALFSLPILAAWEIFDTAVPPRIRMFRLILTLSGMLLMGSLVIIKQHLLDRELLNLLRTSQKSLDNLQRLQTQLLQSEKLASLGQLVGGAAHELNNPLTAMLGYSELLMATPLSTEQRSLIEKMGLQVRRTRTLVSNLLTFAKQTPTQKTALDLNTLAQTAIRLCQPQLSSRNIQVNLELSQGLPRILGDSNQLLQVCIHITNNALNAMTRNGGALTVRTNLQNNLVVLEYADGGPGMAEPDRVFDPFYTTRPVGQGSGLGLSACYGIVQEHSGTITCRNRPEGGATFRIELPAVLGDGKTTAGGSAKAAVGQRG